MDEPMNNPTVNPVPPRAPGERPPQINAPELDAGIVARPLVGNEFLDPRPKNPAVIFRWIEHKARDGFRYHQCLAQGYAVATEADIQNPEQLQVFNREGGTKFINGDLILMKIDRARYLGAIKHRVEQALYTSDPAVRQAIAKRAAQADLTPAAQAKIAVFAPGAADLKQVGIDVNKIPGLAGAPKVEKGTGVDIRNNKA